MFTTEPRRFRLRCGSGITLLTVVNSSDHDSDLDASRLPDLPLAVLTLIRQIPSGRVATYGDIARALGDDDLRSARWIGELLRNHSHDDDCPCHRVVRLTGELGLYCLSDARFKEQLLRAEGIPFDDRGRVDLSACRFDQFESERPLARLIDLQEQWAAVATLTPLSEEVKFALGLDVAYPANSEAVGAAVLVEAGSLSVVREWTCQLTVSFPYIPGFLSFRELPVLLQVWRQVTESGVRPDVVFVDGNGRLHPRLAGIATCFGVLADVPTLGIGKSLLCGRYARSELTPAVPQPIMHRDELIGYAVQNKPTSKPIYVSPGHKITADEALRVARAMFGPHRLPEPVYHADRLTKWTSRT